METLGAAAQEAVQEVAQEEEVSEVADQEVEQEAEAEAEEAEASSSSLNGARTENLTVLDWPKIAKKMSMLFLLYYLSY